MGQAGQPARGRRALPERTAEQLLRPGSPRACRRTRTPGRGCPGRLVFPPVPLGRGEHWTPMLLLKEELAVFRRELPNLLTQRGQFAVVRGEEVAGAWPTY